MGKRIERGTFQPAQPAPKKAPNKQMLATSNKVEEVARILPSQHSFQKNPPRNAREVTADTKQVSKDIFSRTVGAKRGK